MRGSRSKSSRNSIATTRGARQTRSPQCAPGKPPEAAVRAGPAPGAVRAERRPRPHRAPRSSSRHPISAGRAWRTRRASCITKETPRRAPPAVRGQRLCLSNAGAASGRGNRSPAAAPPSRTRSRASPGAASAAPPGAARPGAARGRPRLGGGRRPPARRRVLAAPAAAGALRCARRAAGRRGAAAPALPTDLSRHAALRHTAACAAAAAAAAPVKRCRRSGRTTRHAPPASRPLSQPRGSGRRARCPANGALGAVLSRPPPAARPPSTVLAPRSRARCPARPGAGSGTESLPRSWAALRPPPRCV